MIGFKKSYESLMNYLPDDKTVLDPYSKIDLDYPKHLSLLRYSKKQKGGCITRNNVKNPLDYSEVFVMTYAETYKEVVKILLNSKEGILFLPFNFFILDSFIPIRIELFKCFSTSITIYFDEDNVDNCLPPHTVGFYYSLRRKLPKKRRNFQEFLSSTGVSMVLSLEDRFGHGMGFSSHERIPMYRSSIEIEAYTLINNHGYVSNIIFHSRDTEDGRIRLEFNKDKRLIRKSSSNSYSIVFSKKIPEKIEREIVDLFNKTLYNIRESRKDLIFKSVSGVYGGGLYKRMPFKELCIVLKQILCGRGY